MTTLDPRLHAYRADLAAAALRERVSAPRYVAGSPAQVVRGTADLRREPAAAAPLDTQLLCGEQVAVYDEADGWAWVQNAADDYVGYVESSALGPAVQIPTHSVAVLRTFLYPEPNLKTTPLDYLSMAAPATVVGTRDRFSEVKLASGASAWIFGRHLAKIGETASDYVATALQFVGVPYLWGGKTSLGLDCSGLVQVCMARAGIACPRDTYMQAASLGTAQPAQADRKRGDLIFFPGHVAIALDGDQVVHASGHAMLVCIEPLADLVERVKSEGGGHGITGVRRP